MEGTAFLSASCGGYGCLFLSVKGLAFEALVTMGALLFRDKVTIPFCGGQS